MLVARMAQRIERVYGSLNFFMSMALLPSLIMSLGSSIKLAIPDIQLVVDDGQKQTNNSKHGAQEVQPPPVVEDAEVLLAFDQAVLLGLLVGEHRFRTGPVHGSSTNSIQGVYG